MHEATHAALDAFHRDTPAWKAAQEADDRFISDYAEERPTTEDLAESFVAWFIVRYRPSIVSSEVRDKILSAIPNRLAYMDRQSWPMAPYELQEE